MLACPLGLLLLPDEMEGSALPWGLSVHSPTAHRCANPAFPAVSCVKGQGNPFKWIRNVVQNVRHLEENLSVRRLSHAWAAGISNQLRARTFFSVLVSQGLLFQKRGWGKLYFQIIFFLFDHTW